MKNNMLMKLSWAYKSAERAKIMTAHDTSLPLEYDIRE